MGTLTDREFNLEGWGSDKRLIEGPCGHCQHAVAFKEPEQHPSLAFKQLIRGEDDLDEVRTHFFIMGICPRPRCQQATIVYRQESTFIYQGNQQETTLLQERVIFPGTSHRNNLPEEVPSTLRELYREATSIESLSPNGAAFLARRILEQTLRDRFEKPKAKLANLIDEFLQTESPPSGLHRMMHDIREFGNIAGHPAQDQQGEWTTVDPAEASYTLDVVAEVLDYVYIMPVRRQAMRERWQSKKRGEIPASQTPSQIVVGGSESIPPVPGADEDEIPF